MTENVFRVLQQKFDLKLIGSDAKADLQAVMGDAVEV